MKVWVEWDIKRKTTIAKSLYNTPIEKTPTEWTLEEVSNSNEKFDSVKIVNITKNIKDINSPLTLQLNPQNSFLPLKEKSPYLFEPSSSKAQLAVNKKTLSPFESTSNKTQLTSNHPSSSQFSISQPAPDYARELVNLSNMYEPDLKYRGDDDSFDFELNIFLELCEKSGLPEEIYAKAYSTMLTGPALTHYYSITSNGHRKNFNKLSTATRDYFEGPETKRNRSARWESLNLPLVIAENESKGKSTLECLMILVKELRFLQLSLDPEYRSDKHLRLKLINACRNVRACQLACFKTSDTLSCLINDLQSSISTAEGNKEESTTQLFTDRRFHKIDLVPINATFATVKDIGHIIIPEQEKVKKIFKKRLFQRFKDNADHYIAEIEGRADDIDQKESNLEFEFDTLILETDTPTEDEEVSDVEESFLTSVGSFEKTQEIFLNLADNSFIHAVTGEDPTTLANEEDTDSNILMIKRYNDKYFYGIVIDTGASKYSTAGHKQSLALKKISNTYLDTTKAGSIKVQFGIGSSTSLGTTLLNTLIGNIQYHIVDADTPFLLSLLDMERL
ncbi:putative glycosyl [Erysiphe necator]|uniref:Putative glycosyl n=1 Tax=Uncinula necator TaxID=52586 RepID=A0A0B1PFH0_UNCNE|nr:putative glycosyl [Erysiphe necator]